MSTSEREQSALTLRDLTNLYKAFNRSNEYFLSKWTSIKIVLVFFFDRVIYRVTAIVISNKSRACFTEKKRQQANV